MTLRATLKLAGIGFAAVAGLAACGGGGGASSGSSSTSPPPATLNLLVSDTPSSKITVLSFQIQITAAVLQPGNVSVLPKPVTVDLAQLISDTGFLASSVVDSATYTSLELTYANPQVTLLNNTGATISAHGQSCAAGATCTYAPVLNNATLSISSGVFPLTLTASSSTGINMDLSIPDLLQSDLSISFANGSSVNLSLLGSGPVRVDDVLGTVTSVSGTQVNLTTAFGDSLVLAENSASTYKFPTSVCPTAAASCIMAGQVVALDASLDGDGTLVVDSMSYLGDSGASLIRALVLSGASGSTPSAQLLLLHGFNVSSLSPGQVATVTFGADAAYSVATAASPAVPNASFASAADLLPGQEVIVGVGSDVVASSTPSFTTSAVFLQSSQVIGDVASVDTTNSAVMIDTLTGLFTASGLHIQAIDVQADTDTTLLGFGALSALNPGQLIVAQGPLLHVAGGTPAIAAVQIRALP
jgi:hypothetical protein